MSIELEKIKYYCAYQERSHSQVRTKLIALKVYGLELENMMTTLIEENFLNEERFACSIARGKFYYKKWGKNKIIQTLKLHKVSAYLINKALKEIDADDYDKMLETLAEKKLETLKSEKNKFKKMNKLKNYLLQKGYESDLIMDVIKKHFK